MTRYSFSTFSIQLAAQYAALSYEWCSDPLSSISPLCIRFWLLNVENVSCWLFALEDNFSSAQVCHIFRLDTYFMLLSNKIMMRSLKLPSSYHEDLRSKVHVYLTDQHVRIRVIPASAKGGNSDIFGNNEKQAVIIPSSQLND